MNQLFYPAVFHKAEEGGFRISFPDIPECLTESDDFSQTYRMATEALVSRKKEHLELPLPSAPDSIQTEGGTLVVIEFAL